MEPLAIQRQAALTRGNEVRSRRSGLKRQLKAGDLKPQAILFDVPWWCESWTVEGLLCSVRGLGKVKVRQISRRTQIPGSLKLGRLTRRQRLVLVDELNRRGR